MKVLRLISRLSTASKPAFSRPVVRRLGTLGLVATTAAVGFFGFQKLHMKNQLIITQVDDDLAEGEMREIKVGQKEDDAVLLTKVDGVYYCVQNKCPHFGAPLSKSANFGDKVVCNWHNAQFSVKTGRTQIGPVMNGLATYKVQVKDGKVIIEIPAGQLNAGKNFAKVPEQLTGEKIVIIGGGAAGNSAAQTLRQAGYSGQITILSEEQELPYDRTILSKMVDTKIDSLKYRKQQFYTEHKIEVKRGSKVQSVDFKKKVIEAKDGRLKYDKLLIATGCSAVVPPFINGEALTLRSWSDLERIQKEIESKGVKKITIVGGSFIGLQFASAIKKKYKEGIDVVVCEYFDTPFERVLGSEVGQVLQKLHESNGVKFETGVKVLQKQAKDNKESLTIERRGDGKKHEIESDMVLFATGVKPNTEFLKNSEIKLAKDNGIEADTFLRTSVNDVYAAGDIVSYPYWYNGERVRIEHYNEAIHQGSIAALNMIGRATPLDHVPYFWTNHYASSLKYSGYGSKWDSVHIDGDLAKKQFLAFYAKGEKVIAVAGMGKPLAVSVINEAMRLAVLPSLSEIKAGFDLSALTKKVKDENPGCKKCQKIQMKA